MPLLQEQLYFDTKVKPDKIIPPFEVDLTVTDIIILAESTDEGFLACTVTPLYTVEGGIIPGVSIDIGQGEYIHINNPYPEYQLRIHPAFWLTNISVTIWQGLPDEPLPDTHSHTNEETLGRISEQNNKLYFRNQMVCDHTHNNLVTISKFSESEGKLYFLNEQIPNHTHNNLDTVSKLSELEGKLYFDGSPVAELNHNHENQLVLSKLSANNGTLLFYGVPVVEDQHTHTNLTILSKFSEVEQQLLYDNQPIASDMTEVITAIDAQTTLLTNRLTAIENTIANLEVGGSSGQLVFTIIPLSPTYQVSNANWVQQPNNLSAITDGDSNTSTNGFSIGGVFYQRGELILSPGVFIPEFTRLNIRLGLTNNTSGRGYFDIQVKNSVSNNRTVIWANLQQLNNTPELIVNIDRIIPFSWSELAFGLQDIGAGEPNMKIYDLRVWSVTN